MKYTELRVNAILQRHENLIDTAKRFADYKIPHGHRHGNDLRFVDDSIEWEVNTSCHCHPTYERQVVGTIKEFLEWCSKHNY